MQVYLARLLLISLVEVTAHDNRKRIDSTAIRQTHAGRIPSIPFGDSNHPMKTQVCQSCGAVWNSLDFIPCPRCNSVVSTVKSGQEREVITNLEFAKAFNEKALEVSKLTDDELTAYMLEHEKMKEYVAIALNAGNRERQERGKKARIQVHESDMRYVMPEQTVLEQLKRKRIPSGIKKLIDESLKDID